MGLMRAASFCLLTALVLLAALLPSSLGQMCCTPCSVVVLKLAVPTPVRAGKLFSVVSTLSIWCYGFLPKIRVDLVDAASYKMLTSAFILLSYSTTGSYLVSMADNATARNAPGSWALVLQAYVIERENGYPVGWWSQLFQIVVLP